MSAGDLLKAGQDEGVLDERFVTEFGLLLFLVSVEEIVISVNKFKTIK